MGINSLINNNNTTSNSLNPPFTYSSNTRHLTITDLDLPQLTQLKAHVTSICIENDRILKKLYDQNVKFEQVNEVDISKCKDPEIVNIYPNLFPNASHCSMDADTYKYANIYAFSAWQTTTSLHLTNLPTLANLDSTKIQNLILLTYSDSSNPNEITLEYDRQFFCKISPETTRLNLSNMSKLTDEVACRIIKQFPNLCLIHLRGCPFITEKTVRYIEERAPYAIIRESISESKEVSALTLQYSMEDDTPKDEKLTIERLQKAADLGNSSVLLESQGKKAKLEKD